MRVDVRVTVPSRFKRPFGTCVCTMCGTCTQVTILQLVKPNDERGTPIYLCRECCAFAGIDACVACCPIEGDGKVG